MAPPAGTARVVLSGRLAGGEIWTSGFWVTGAGIHSQGTANAFASVTAGAMASSDASGAMTVTLGQLCATSTFWDKTTVYAYAGGTNQAAYIGEFTNNPPLAGAGNQHVPNQCALVLSLRTGLPGRRYRGRMYLPAPSMLLDQNGNVLDSQVTPVVNAWASLFTDMNASDGEKVVVVSATGSVATQVSTLIMDTRPDIQRRRADKQVITTAQEATVGP